MRKTFLTFTICFFLLLSVQMAGAVTFGPALGIEHRSKSVSPPAALIDDNGRIYLSWIEEEKDVNSIYIASSDDGGKTFSGEIKVNGADNEPASIHQSPSIALGKKGEIYLLWAGKAQGGGFNADLRFSRSVDGGRSFTPSIKVNDNKNGSVGFESISVAPDGTIFIAWLDGRDRDAGGGSGTYFTASRDGGKSFEKNLRIDSNSCPCCRTAVNVAPDGTVYVSWRKIYNNNIREIVLSGSTDNGRSFTRPVIVGEDKWEIPGCPHRGPFVGVKDNGNVFVFWYAEVEGDPKVYMAESKDRGVTFKKEAVAHKKGFPDNPVLFVDGDKVFLSWQETTPVLSNIIFESRNNGEVKREQLNQDTRKAANPVISVNKKGEVIIAWLKMEIKTARAVVRVGR